MIKKFLPIMCVLAMPLFGDPLEGEYGVTGFDPYTKEHYQGTASVKHRGEVYDFTWHIKPQNQIYFGTGIRKGDIISVVYKKSHTNPMEMGLHTYQIDGNTLSGKWVAIGRNKQGAETLKQIN